MVGYPGVPLVGEAVPLASLRFARTPEERAA
jgi:hypothetical protein